MMTIVENIYIILSITEVCTNVEDIIINHYRITWFAIFLLSLLLIQYYNSMSSSFI